MDKGKECEQWLPVRGWEGLYEVSDQGQVRSLDRWVVKRNGQRQVIAGRIKSLPKLKLGYPVVHLAKDGQTTTRTVHTVVLNTFVGPRPAGHVACHNDGDPSNNRLANLRWDTQSNNLLDAIRHGTHSRFLATRSYPRPCEVVTLKGERWKPVVGFERFEVSNEGRVRSPSGRILNARTSTGNYHVVTFNINGRKETRRIHRVVLEAFVGPAPEGTFGCHIDGNPANNRLSNLRWDTQANNLRDVVGHGRHHCSNRTHCQRGHEYTPENTRLTARGHRRCIQCDKATHAKRRAIHGERIRAQKRAAWQRQVEAAGRIYTPTGPRKRGTKTHCAYGHERTPENTIYDAAGQRRCGVCRREQKLQRYRQKREAQGQRYFPGGVRTHCYHGHEFTPENSVYEGRDRVRRCKTCREQYQLQHGHIRTHCENGHPLTAENTEVEDRRRRCKICRQEPGSQLELPLHHPRTHCKKGHPFTAENTVLGSKDGRRRCRICRDDKWRQNYQANGEAINERHRQLYKKKREAQGKTYNPGRRKTHCVNGHELTPETIYLDKNGRRAGCKACRSARTRAYYYANHDAMKKYHREYERRRREAQGTAGRKDGLRPSVGPIDELLDERTEVAGA
jgi:hypothetical protein